MFEHEGQCVAIGGRDQFVGGTTDGSETARRTLGASIKTYHTYYPSSLPLSKSLRRSRLARSDLNRAYPYLEQSAIRLRQDARGDGDHAVPALLLQVPMYVFRLLLHDYPAMSRSAIVGRSADGDRRPFRNKTLTLAV